MDRFHREYNELKAQEKQFRRDSIAEAARGIFDADETIARTDAVRGLRRMGYHVWRIIRHLHAAQLQQPRAGEPQKSQPAHDGRGGVLKRASTL